jgi:putative tryptophan/tyrosine transport system substrate-binding protein
MRRREFITLLGGAAAWPLSTRAQQPELPVVAYIDGGTANAEATRLAAFRKGLGDIGYTEGRNVAVEHHWLDGHYERLPALLADLVRRRVAVIATPASIAAALAAKAATATIPIVFGVGDNPVTLGLVASLARPGGNATGINFLSSEVGAKRLGLMHELLPTARRFAVLINPGNPSSAKEEELQDAARVLGLELLILRAGSPDEIDAAFAALVRGQSHALFIAGDGFFTSRAAQFATLAVRDRIPASYASREMVDAGLLMSYGVNFIDAFRQVGNYVGRVLKGEKPADLPVEQPAKFEFVINVRTAKALGLEVPNSLQLLADEVIE